MTCSSLVECACNVVGDDPGLPEGRRVVGTAFQNRVVRHEVGSVGHPAARGAYRWAYLAVAYLSGAYLSGAYLDGVSESGVSALGAVLVGVVCEEELEELGKVGGGQPAGVEVNVARRADAAGARVRAETPVRPPELAAVLVPRPINVLSLLRHSVAMHSRCYAFFSVAMRLFYCSEFPFSVAMRFVPVAVLIYCGSANFLLLIYMPVAMHLFRLPCIYSGCYGNIPVAMEIFPLLW